MLKWQKPRNFVLIISTVISRHQLSTLHWLAMQPPTIPCLTITCFLHSLPAHRHRISHFLDGGNTQALAPCHAVLKLLRQAENENASAPDTCTARVSQATQRAATHNTQHQKRRNASTFRAAPPKSAAHCHPSIQIKGQHLRRLHLCEPLSRVASSHPPLLPAGKASVAPGVNVPLDKTFWRSALQAPRSPAQVCALLHMRRRR